MRIKLDEYPGETLSGRITQVATVDLQVAPLEISHKTGGSLTTVTDAAGVERAMGVSYEARVRIDHVDIHMLPGFRGRAD